jgi:hypothetical protein
MNDLKKIRTDVVGSLLRPANVKDARVLFDGSGSGAAVPAASDDSPLYPPLPASCCCAATCGSVPILLQRSFCTADQKFSGLYARLSCKDVGDLIA